MSLGQTLEVQGEVQEPAHSRSNTGDSEPGEGTKV